MRTPTTAGTGVNPFPKDIHMNRLTLRHAAAAIAIGCSSLASAQDLDTTVRTSPSGGAEVEVQARGAAGARTVVWIAFDSSIVPVATPFGPMLIDARLIVGSLDLAHDATGRARATLGIPISIDRLEAELQGAQLDPSNALRLTDGNSIGFRRAGSGAGMTGSHDGETGRWVVDVMFATPGSSVEVWTDGFDVPISMHRSGVVDATGGVHLEGTANLPGDARLQVRIREPGSTQWRWLGHVPGTAR